MFSFCTFVAKSFSEKRTYSDHNSDENTVLPLRTYPRRSVPDERPITPLRDRMVYDVKHSSLDFRDGLYICNIVSNMYII